MTTLDKETLSKIFKNGFNSIIDEGTNGHPSSLSRYYLDDSEYDASWYMGELFNDDDTYVYNNFYSPELNEFIDKYKDDKSIVEEYHKFKSEENINASIPYADFVQTLFDIEFGSSEDKKNYHKLYNMYEYMKKASSRLVNAIIKHTNNKENGIAESGAASRKVIKMLVRSGLVVEAADGIDLIADAIDSWVDERVLQKIKELNLDSKENLSKEINKNSVVELASDKIEELDGQDNFNKVIKEYKDKNNLSEMKQRDYDNLFILFDERSNDININKFEPVHNQIMDEITDAIVEDVTNEAERAIRENKNTIKVLKKEIISRIKKFKKLMKLPLMFSNKAERILTDNKDRMNELYDDELEYETAMIFCDYMLKLQSLSSQKVYKAIAEDNTTLPFTSKSNNE